MKENDYFSAAWSCDFAAMSCCLSSGIDVNALIDNETALFYVTDIECARVLVGAGININHQNNLGLTAFHMNIISLHDDIFDLLLLSGADLEIKSKNGMDAMNYAKSEHSKDCEIKIEREMLRRAADERIEMRSNSAIKKLEDDEAMGL